MEAEEHFYSEDPTKGPPDVRTTLPGVSYYFIGNGHIEVVIQTCTGDAGSPLGLLIMHPEKFGPKRNALSFDPAIGLAKTMIGIQAAGELHLPTADTITAKWRDLRGVPVVEALWSTDVFEVSESFFCPDLATPVLLRQIQIRNRTKQAQKAEVKTGVRDQVFHRDLVLGTGEKHAIDLAYAIVQTAQGLSVVLQTVDSPKLADDAVRYWQNIASGEFSSALLAHFFTAARNQLPATIAQSGMMDSSIWQYNLEWVRDQAMVVTGLVTSGHFEIARSMLSRLLTEFVSAEGDTVDSSRKRPIAEIELDQNGELLWAVKTYVDWTGDLELVRTYWPKITATADFPLRAAFRHQPSGLLHNQREYWERHALHGIEDGMELMYQFFVAVGLEAAADLANRLGHAADATRWRQAAHSLKEAMLFDAQFALVHDGRFIKRRTVDGDVQQFTIATAEAKLPAGVPLIENIPHRLNPDSSFALPIAYEFIDPAGELATKTLEDLEQLWNTRWSDGGYGRYHFSSEPDSPGPWPFASMFIARAYLEAGRDDKVWRVLDWLNAVPGAEAGSWFEFYGPRPIPPYPQIGLVPWTWAEILFFVIHHLFGIRPEENTVRVRPRLLSGMTNAQASVRLRNTRLHLQVRKAGKKEKAGFWQEEAFTPYDPAGMRIDMPKRDCTITAIVP